VVLFYIADAEMKFFKKTYDLKPQRFRLSASRLIERIYRTHSLAHSLTHSLAHSLTRSLFAENRGIGLGSLYLNLPKIDQILSSCIYNPGDS